MDLSDVLPKRKHKQQKKSGGDKTFGRNRAKCASYRSRVGKPRGRGVPGNKLGRNSG